MKYYTITPSEAALIGEIDVSSCEKFNPFVGEQENGKFVISQENYEQLKNTEQFKKVNFASKALIEEGELKPKETA